jgi:hypothetical protein
MASLWWFFEPAVNGDFGRRIRKATRLAVAIVAIIIPIWRWPEAFLLHSFVSWKVHDVQHQLDHLFPTLSTVPTPPGRQALRLDLTTP